MLKMSGAIPLPHPTPEYVLIAWCLIKQAIRLPYTFREHNNNNNNKVIHKYSNHYKDHYGEEEV